MAAGGVPKRLPITLSHLKIIDLYAICFGEVNEVSIVLCLIRSSPNLEKIIIEVCTHETTAIDHVLELLEIQDWSDVSLNQLREVEIRNLSGTRFELEFIKLLLAKSPMLETMLIEPDLEKVADKGLRILKELTRFWRSSPKAKITYNDPDGSRNENEPLKIKFSKWFVFFFTSFGLSDTER
ncbi:F-box/FBD/LRR-repeat protein At1g13570-like [Camellia sinensis]|uniref:F-box/FBD/LRR-repeat protein At1g13570-like n=1 Tax=Camellia sinensis TaxID=4442 RepID=UPI0010364344|nr:F-box/FBD/LRR-repeat protein At1g13570-like [Camellia sinensis]